MNWKNREYCKKKYSTRVGTAFLELVKCGLDRMKPHPEYFYMLNAEDWEVLYRLVQKQAVTGICFSAAELLPPGMRKAARLLSGH